MQNPVERQVGEAGPPRGFQALIAAAHLLIITPGLYMHANISQSRDRPTTIASILFWPK